MHANGLLIARIRFTVRPSETFLAFVRFVSACLRVTTFRELESRYDCGLPWKSSDGTRVGTNLKELGLAQLIVSNVNDHLHSIYGISGVQVPAHRPYALEPRRCRRKIWRWSARPPRRFSAVVWPRPLQNVSYWWLLALNKDLIEQCWCAV